jgi:4-hydroxyacetophenone monooxygenase
MASSRLSRRLEVALGQPDPRRSWVSEFPGDAVDHADPGVLLAALVQFTGDLGLLERAEGHRQTRRESTSADVDQRLRSEARTTLAQLGERAATSTPPLDDETLGRIMNLCAGEEVPMEYLPLMLEEANFDGADLRRFEWSGPTTPSTSRGFRVGIIGGGLAGIGLAVRLQEAGVDFTIFEKNASIGGTWVENDYPDLRVDVPNQFYSYSFEPNPDWSDHYARRAEIAAYIDHCADKYGVRRNVLLETEVLSARYDTDRSNWSVHTNEPDGGERTRDFNVVVSAVGMLNRPSVPDMPGLESFDGTWFHSSRWDHGLELAGRHVAVIGTGASAMQFVPAIAPEVDELTIFQRASHWALPNPDYRRSVTAEEKWLLKNVPFYAGWYRFLMFWRNSDRNYPSFKVDPDWADQDLSISLANEKLRRAMTKHIRSELGPDNALVDVVLPDYPPLGKRILQDNGWYRTLLRDNVELVVEPIEMVTPDGIRTTDGTVHEADVVVLATGFHANKFLWPIEFVGRAGTVLHDVWRDDPRAHLGITVPGFPNLFCLYGPNTNPMVGSVIFMLECQVGYIMGCIRAMIEGGHASIECRQEAHDEYNARVDAENEGLVWRHPKVRSYYNNPSGRVTTNAPWRLVDYWRMTRTPDLADFHLAEASLSETSETS